MRPCVFHSCGGGERERKEGGEGSAPAVILRGSSTICGQNCRKAREGENRKRCQVTGFKNRGPQPSHTRAVTIWRQVELIMELASSCSGGVALQLQLELQRAQGPGEGESVSASSGVTAVRTRGEPKLSTVFERAICPKCKELFRPPHRCLGAFDLGSAVGIGVEREGTAAQPGGAAGRGFAGGRLLPRLFP
ncbi:hypothetical protein COCON_G00031820 [Conger conger]|uniref:Uncharacterized protein n=1 Tax=Conger conger TaxID=82655 RepID=A0A9Q1DYX0_CONCO|nr:hypothetical protein COCON_G00031820 [Conger conger]